MCVRSLRLLAAACSATALSFIAGPAEAASTIQITKVYVNSPGSDLPATNGKINAEYTVIKNTGSNLGAQNGATPVADCREFRDG